MTRNSRGLTILELIVTLTIVLVLVGIGAASYSVVTAASEDAEAERIVDRVVLAEQAWASRNATWADDVSVLSVGRELTLTSEPSSGPTVASIAVSTDNRLGVAVLSSTGTCFFRVLADPLVGGGDSRGRLEGGAPCSGAAALEVPSP